MKVLTVRPETGGNRCVCEPPLPKMPCPPIRPPKEPVKCASRNDINELFNSEPQEVPKSGEIERLERRIAAIYATKDELPNVSFTIDFQGNIPCLIVTDGDKKYRFIGSEV